MNIFDAVVIGATLVTVILGYRAGLLRSLAVIFGYVLAAPVAIMLTPMLAPLIMKQTATSATMSAASSAGSNALIFAAVFLGVGIATGALLRSAVGLAVGEDVSLPDRAAGATLGAVRTVLLAILMVLVFDRIIPPKQRPAWLAQSKLRPVLTAAGEQGVRTLPPEVIAQIDRMKKQRGI